MSISLLLCISDYNVIEEKLFDFMNSFRNKMYKKCKKRLVIFQKSHVINPQYLINYESDQKSVTNKKGAYLKSLNGVCYQIMYLQRLWCYYNSKISNSEFDKKCG